MNYDNNMRSSTVATNEPVLRISARDVKFYDASLWEIKAEVQNALNDIRALIVDAHKNHLSSITYNLKMNFLVSGLTNSDTQRIIYSKIITAIKKQSFNCKISLTQKRVMLYISWKSILSDDVIQYQNNIIKECIIK